MGGEAEAKVQSRGVYSAWSVGSDLRGLLCGAGLWAASSQGSVVLGGERGSRVSCLGLACLRGRIAGRGRRELVVVPARYRWWWSE